MEQESKRKWYSLNWWKVLQVFGIGLVGYIMGVVTVLYALFK